MVPCSFWFGLRNQAPMLSSQAGTVVSPETTIPAKTLLKVQTSCTGSVKIRFSISTNRNKRDGNKNSYTDIKCYDNF